MQRAPSKANTAAARRASNSPAPPAQALPPLATRLLLPTPCTTSLARSPSQLPLAPQVEKTPPPSSYKAAFTTTQVATAAAQPKANKRKVVDQGQSIFHPGAGVRTTSSLGSKRVTL